MQPLFSPVVQTRDTLQREQTTDAQSELILKSVWRIGRAEKETFVLIMIVQKRHTTPARLTVRTDDAAFHLFAMLEHLDDSSWGDQSFRHRRQPEKEREVQRRVHADQIGFFGSMAADETRDLLLVVIHLAKSEKILLPDAERKLTHRVAKRLRKVRLDELQRVDAKAIHVELGNEILVGTDQNGVDGNL